MRASLTRLTMLWIGNHAYRDQQGRGMHVLALGRQARITSGKHGASSNTQRQARLGILHHNFFGNREYDCSTPLVM